MSNHQYRSRLEQEINKINKVIDNKIFFGLDYREDARRHKKLLAQIRKTRKASIWSWGAASLKYVSMFLF
jgi:hypothetical protein